MTPNGNSGPFWKKQNKQRNKQTNKNKTNNNNNAFLYFSGHACVSMQTWVPPPPPPPPREEPKCETKFWFLDSVLDSLIQVYCTASWECLFIICNGILGTIIGLLLLSSFILDRIKCTTFIFLAKFWCF